MLASPGVPPCAAFAAAFLSSSKTERDLRAELGDWLTLEQFSGVDVIARIQSSMPANGEVAVASKEFRVIHDPTGPSVLLPLLARVDALGVRMALVVLAGSGTWGVGLSAGPRKMIFDPVAGALRETTLEDLASLLCGQDLVLLPLVARSSLGPKLDASLCRLRKHAKAAAIAAKRRELEALQARTTKSSGGGASTSGGGGGGGFGAPGSSGSNVPPRSSGHPSDTAAPRSSGAAREVSHLTARSGAGVPAVPGIEEVGTSGEMLQVPAVPLPTAPLRVEPQSSENSAQVLEVPMPPALPPPLAAVAGPSVDVPALPTTCDSPGGQGSSWKPTARHDEVLGGMLSATLKPAVPSMAPSVAPPVTQPVLQSTVQPSTQPPVPQPTTPPALDQPSAQSHRPPELHQHVLGTSSREGTKSAPTGVDEVALRHIERDLEAIQAAVAADSRGRAEIASQLEGQIASVRANIQEGLGGEVAAALAEAALAEPPIVASPWLGGAPVGSVSPLAADGPGASASESFGESFGLSARRPSGLDASSIGASGLGALHLGTSGLGASGTLASILCSLEAEDILHFGARAYAGMVGKLLADYGGAGPGGSSVANGRSCSSLTGVPIAGEASSGVELRAPPAVRRTIEDNPLRLARSLRVGGLWSIYEQRGRVCLFFTGARILRERAPRSGGNSTGRLPSSGTLQATQYWPRQLPRLSAGRCFESWARVPTCVPRRTRRLLPRHTAPSPASKHAPSRMPRPRLGGRHALGTLTGAHRRAKGASRRPQQCSPRL